MTKAPASISWAAISAPIPFDAPVTKTVLFCTLDTMHTNLANRILLVKRTFGRYVNEILNRRESGETKPQ